MRKGHGGIYNTGRAKEEKQHLQVKLAALPERERESDGMQCGTGDQIIPLSQQAGISKHLSDGGLDSDTQLSDERGEIGDQKIKHNV